MSNERLAADMATMLDGLQDQFRGIAELQRQRSLLTATASVSDQRIQVTVNADGMVVATKFSDDISDLDYDEIADYVTAAAQAATEGVLRRGRELMQPLIERKSRLPRLSEFIEGAPDLEDVIPVAPPPPKEPPTAATTHHDDDEDGPRSLIADQED